MAGWWEELDGPLLGRYRIDRLLGEGGMARVFAATDLKSGRVVAIKTPKIESFPPDRVEELLKRFNREFRSQIEEPIQGVVPVYDADEVTDRHGVVRPILVMQMLTGGSLGTRLGGRAGAREHTQTLGEVLRWISRIADAVDSLHQRKFLHRDIKPDNILFDRDDKPFLADFGVVGLLDSENPSDFTVGGTGTGLSPGSPGYMSPESIKADQASRNAPSSDQFSLGITVYEALAGRLPVSVSSIGEWYAALTRWEPTSILVPCPDLPTAAAAAVMKAISAHPNERFLSCSDFAKALEQAAYAPRAAPPPLRASAPPPTAAVPPATGSKAPKRMLAVAGVLVGLVLVALLAKSLWGGARQVDEVAPPLAQSQEAGPAPVGTTQATEPALAAPPQAQGDVVVTANARVPKAYFDFKMPANEGNIVPTSLSGKDPGVVGLFATDRDTCSQSADDSDIDQDNDGVGNCFDLCETTLVERPTVGLSGCPVDDALVLYYPRNGTELTPEFRGYLDITAARLRANPLRIVSATGLTEPDEDFRLAVRRAKAVIQYLAKKGVHRNQLMEPLEVFPGASKVTDAQALARLRRVEVQISPDDLIKVPVKEQPPSTDQPTHIDPTAADPATNAAACGNNVDADSDGIGDCFDLCLSDDFSKMFHPSVSPFGCMSSFTAGTFPRGSTRRDAKDAAFALKNVREHPGKRIGLWTTDSPIAKQRLQVIYDELLAKGVDTSLMQQPRFKHVTSGNGIKSECHDDCWQDQFVSMDFEQ